MNKLGDVRVREFVHPDSFCDAKAWNVEVYAKPSGRYATPESEPVWLCVNPTIEPFTVKEYAERFAERYADKARIAELEAELKLCQDRLDWLLARCTVNEWGSISIPCGSNGIIEAEKAETIRRIDDEIEKDG